MKKIILFALVAFFANGVHAQDFITVWNLNIPGYSINSFTFGVGTTGTVNYTWETIPAGATGSGSFSGTTATITGLPVNAIIRLKINPTNFNRIEIGAGVAGWGGGYLVDIEQWGGVAWTSMERAFSGCAMLLNISATDVPNLSLVTNMSSMFWWCQSLNGPANINMWNTSNVTNMRGMFAYALNFNQPIGNWNTSNVTNMSLMFQDDTSFNQPIGNWNTSNVDSMSFMFSSAKNFNQPIGNWNTSNVTYMNNMFDKAFNFNQPIGNWNTIKVKKMNSMFASAYSFNQPIGSWNLSNVTDMGWILYFCGMDCTNYSSTLNGWANNINTPNALNLRTINLNYGTNAVSSRNYLTSTKGWWINGDAMINTACYPTNTSTINTKNLITISPNPTNSIFKIECPMNGANVILYNSFGQKLMTTKIENQTSLIDISHFSKGIYIAEILDDKTSYRVKIIKD